MKRKIFAFAAGLLITAGSILPASAATCSESPWLCESTCITCTESTPTVSDDRSTMRQIEVAAGELINDRREANGLDPLQISADLSAKARVKAKDMKQNQYFSHTSPTYGSPFAMMQSLGISYRSAAENIAMGYRTAEAVVNAWMASPSHRANILSARYTTLGIGYEDGYWAQWFIR